MAISDSQNILSLLRVYYKDGVQNLMFRNSPVLRKLNKVRVEGKSANFSAMYGRGGAVAAKFTQAKSVAAQTSRNAEFAVTPGQIFSVYMINSKEVQASKTNSGAYMKIAGAQMFAAAEALRKTLAAALYGRGYGELCAWGDTTSLVAGTDGTITLPESAIMKIDVGSILCLKTSVSASSYTTVLTVKEINGSTVTFTPDTSVTPSASDVLCLHGSVDANGNPLLPMGLTGWLPAVASRTSATWNTYIATPFYGVNRSIAADRLAGAFYKAASSESKLSAVQNLLMKVRRQGSTADMIVMNDVDWLDLSKLIQTTNTYFTQTSDKGKKTAVAGFSDIKFSMSTSWVENVYDDPYCEEGRFFILDSSVVEFWSYTNTEKVNDGIADNEPGKQDPMTMDSEGKENDPYGLIIDDYLNIAPGADTDDGPSQQVTLQLFGSFVVTNPSVCGTGIFDGSTPLEV